MQNLYTIGLWATHHTLYVRFCKYASVCTFLYVRFCMYVSVCMLLYVRFCMYASVCTLLYVRFCMYASVCMLLCVCFCMYASVCMLQYVRFCMYAENLWWEVFLEGQNIELVRTGGSKLEPTTKIFTCKERFAFFHTYIPLKYPFLP